MFLLYVDESGDAGATAGSSPYFVLSGLVLHELRWHPTLEAILEMRRNIRARYGLKLREEIHAGHFVSKPGAVSRIPKSLRVRLLRDVLDFEAKLQDVSIINIVVKKAGKPLGYDVFDHAWQALIQRFHNTISHRNFPGPRNADDRGLLITDQTDEKKLRTLVRRSRVYNPVPNKASTGYRQLPLTTLVEDPVHRDSQHSYVIQLADVNAYFLYQREAANKYIRKQGARHYFERLAPVLCKVASSSDPLGVVRL